MYKMRFLALDGEESNKLACVGGSVSQAKGGWTEVQE